MPSGLSKVLVGGWRVQAVIKRMFMKHTCAYTISFIVH